MHESLVAISSPKPIERERETSLLGVHVNVCFHSYKFFWCLFAKKPLNAVKCAGHRIEKERGIKRSFVVVYVKVAAERAYKCSSLLKKVGSPIRCWSTLLPNITCNDISRLVKLHTT